MFDPERIRRWRPLGDEIMLDTVPGNEDAPRDSEFVLASDYDALLGRYVAAMRIVGAVGMEIITLDIP